MSGPFSIGSKIWPGISKLAEESGEVLQVIGKLIGSGGEIMHWDGSNLRERLEEEVGDVLAAAEFVAEKNGLDRQRIEARTRAKLALFEKWHAAEPPLPPQHCANCTGAFEPDPDAGRLCPLCLIRGKSAP